MIDSFAGFTLKDVPRTARFREADLRGLADRLRANLASRGYGGSELFGSSTDLWAFTIDFDGFDISVGVSPDYRGAADRWSAQVHLENPGWRSATRTARLSEMRKIEAVVEVALREGFAASDIEWRR